MRKVNLILLALAVYFLAAPLASAQGGSVEQEIKALGDQTVQAQLKGDIGFFEKYLADDYTAIYASGKLYTKAQDIESFKSGDVKFESIDVHERKIRVYGDTAVSVTLSSSKGTRSGKPFSSDYRTTRVWVKQKGNWKMVLFQTTAVAPASR